MFKPPPTRVQNVHCVGNWLMSLTYVISGPPPCATRATEFKWSLRVPITNARTLALSTKPMFLPNGASKAEFNLCLVMCFLDSFLDFFGLKIFIVVLSST